MATDVEIAVVGGGVVGLAIARRLALSGWDVAVIERHSRPGQETSSRNSEVLHAGLYYPPGSLKAQLCLAGQAALYDFAAEHGVAVARCGKLVVATRESERDALAQLHQTAERNGVAGVRRLTAAEARAREPDLVCVEALFAPSSGVIDSPGLITALERDLISRGGTIAYRSSVAAIERDTAGAFILTLDHADGSNRVTAKHLVLAAGLGGSTLGHMLGGRAGYRVPETYFAKGHYFTYSGRAPFSHLIYPLPGAGSLGIHVTRDVHGAAKFGPDISWVPSINDSFDDQDGARRRAFAEAIERYWPGVEDAKLVPAYTGIRPKLSPQPRFDDFAIHGPVEHGVEGLVALYGIESPGLTASLAIAEIVERALSI